MEYVEGGYLDRLLHPSKPRSYAQIRSDIELVGKANDWSAPYPPPAVLRLARDTPGLLRRAETAEAALETKTPAWIRYSIKKSKLFDRWVVRAHHEGRSSVCDWFDSWDEAIGFVLCVYGWQW